MGVDRGGAVGLVADIDLDEATVNPVLSKMADIRMPDRMRDQGLRQAERVTVGDEPGVDLRRPHPPAPLGHPQRRMTLAAEPRPHVLHVIAHRLHRPGHHRGDVPPPRRLAPLGLPVPDMQHPVPAELRCRRVPPPVGQIQLRGLGPAQPPPVHHLEQRRVPVGGQSPLPPRPRSPLYLVIGIIQEPLHLLAGKRPRLGIALVVVEVGDRVPLMADRHRMVPRAELPLARPHPAIPGIGQELGELPETALIPPDRRRRQVLLRRQAQRPLVHVPRRPGPRVLPGERHEPADQPLPLASRLLPQPAGGLLRLPAPQHRLEHRVLRMQLRHALDQLKSRSPRKIPTSHRPLQPI